MEEVGHHRRRADHRDPDLFTVGRNQIRGFHCRDPNAHHNRLLHDRDPDVQPGQLLHPGHIRCVHSAGKPACQQSVPNRCGQFQGCYFLL